jgi:hypothetical protein
MPATSSLRRTIFTASVALACIAAPASASAVSDGTSNTIMFATSVDRSNPPAITRLMEEEGIGFDFRASRSPFALTTSP